MTDSIEAIEIADTEKAKKIATEMTEWRNIFATKIISKAEQCLQTVTGENWQYFSTKARFLSGREARAEQDFIDGADDRKTTRGEEEKRLNREVIVAMIEFTRIVAHYENIQTARETEARRATIDTCTKLYNGSRVEAILEPVCNDVFMRDGVPDTEYPFDLGKMEEAQLNLALSLLKLSQSPYRRDVDWSKESAELTMCKEILAK